MSVPALEEYRIERMCLELSYTRRDTFGYSAIVLEASYACLTTPLVIVRSLSRSFLSGSGGREGALLTPLWL